ncbi:MAG TPA: hypothetical protein VMF52_03560 [Steroidobacteraceae bacterium]|nr:hypothetical protein [Steroidobacteraceae bacterium]
MKNVSSAQSTPPPRQVPQQVQRHERAERPERVERTERNVEKQAVTVTRSTTESHHSVESRGRQEAVLDSEHKLLYMRNAARVHEDSNEVSRTLTYTQQAAHVTTSVNDGAQPLLDVRV